MMKLRTYAGIAALSALAIVGCARNPLRQETFTAGGKINTYENVRGFTSGGEMDIGYRVTFMNGECGIYMAPRSMANQLAVEDTALMQNDMDRLALAKKQDREVTVVGNKNVGRGCVNIETLVFGDLKPEDPSQTAVKAPEKR